MRDAFECLKCCLDLWLSSIFNCIHICVFLFFEKLFLSNLDTSRQLGYLSSLFSFLSRYCYRNLNPSRFLRFNLDSFSTTTWSIEEVSGCSIASRSIEVYLLWIPLDSSSITFSCVLILNSSWHLSIHQETEISINRVCVTFLLGLSRQNLSLHLPKPFSLTPNLFPKWSSAFRSFFFSGMMLSHSFIMHFISCDQTFGVFENFWDLLRFLQILGWVFV